MQALQFLGAICKSSISSLSASSISRIVWLFEALDASFKPTTLSRLEFDLVKRPSAWRHTVSSCSFSSSLAKTTTILLVVLYFFRRHRAAAIDMRVFPCAAGTTIIWFFTLPFLPGAIVQYAMAKAIAI